MTPWRRPVVGLFVSVLAAGPASGQVGEGLIIQPQIAQKYDRGRNIGVDEQSRPEFAALGLRFGSLTLYPLIEAGIGYTSNTYLVGTGATASPIVYVRPSTRVISDWSRHALQLSATATLRNYLGESRRDERLWELNASGRLDVRRTLALEGEVSASRGVENLFSGEVISDVAAVSRYRRDFASVQGTYTNGRGRAFLVVDYSGLRFDPLPLLGGGIRDQSSRNRDIARLTGQVEYARSPTLSLFAQLSGSRTNYGRPSILTGGSNLDSSAARLLIGANVDFAGRLRGTIGLGYGTRNYDAATFKSVGGLSVESQVQLFPTRRLTVTFSGERAIEDSSLGRASYLSTRIRARADYEVLRNLIINSTIDYSRQSYSDNALQGSANRLGVGGRYLASRRVNVRGSLSYSRRSTNNVQVQRNVTEARVEAGIVYQL